MAPLPPTNHQVFRSPFSIFENKFNNFIKTGHLFAMKSLYEIIEIYTNHKMVLKSFYKRSKKKSKL